MFTAIKSSLPIQTKPAVSTLFASSNNFAGKATPVFRTVRFQQASAGNDEDPDNMEKKQEEAGHEEAEKKGDVMSHSFGEGYATRSDEEGFGGIYGGNQSLSHDDEEKIVHGNSPEYDKSQGSEVKEKEKARNQQEAC
ncbi:hypothetical protein SSX86_025309 [Deinandra increscens subsp. villosa]|uniref:Uncharacterized protein n=1 Tax=Deinandra increscens subsp. villosa TaxID=3103831 RepID=A0AAP0CDZ6_9ASTR